ncbi:hypothetical protein [Tropicimonas sp. S265A]|uniref:hypothetical protein n=1 Tax=Tropicimonas sp. S265A TaxID=3415134 RepID=UPI003C7E46EC
MIDVRPDPAHPRGGYAVLSFDGASVPDESVSVDVFDLYNELYLGKAGWQPERHSFGPYPVDRSGGEAKVVLGPEVVDHLEEFATIRLTLGALSGDVSWPDDIVHSPKAATSDSAIKFGSGPAAPAVAAPIKLREPEPETEPEVATPSQAEEDAPAAPREEVLVTQDPKQTVAEEDGDKKGGLSLPLIIGGVAVVAAIIAALLFLMPEEDVPVAEPEPAPAPIPEPEPIPPVAAAPDPCSDAELSAVASQGFAALGDALRGCGGSVSADVALGLVEGAVAEGDPAALAFFGTLYDSGQTDEIIENQIGLTLGDNPARAAEYYARAKDAGTAEADDLLAGVCRALLLRTDTLSISAREDHCPN